MPFDFEDLPDAYVDECDRRERHLLREDVAPCGQLVEHADWRECLGKGLARLREPCINCARTVERRKARMAQRERAFYVAALSCIEKALDDGLGGLAERACTYNRRVACRRPTEAE